MRTIRDCSVCVVGGCGFLGSHLVRHLLERECRVLVVDNLVAGKLEFIQEGGRLLPGVAFAHHDITGSEEHLRQLFVKFGVKYVFNYAAYPYVPDSFSRPLHVFNVNATGAIKVINAAQEAGCDGILQVSSAELYGACGGVVVDAKEGVLDQRIPESAPVAPHSTYGTAKAAVDYYCQCAWRERRTPVIALRQFNAVGERDETHPYVVPEIISQIARTQDDRKTLLETKGQDAFDRTIPYPEECCVRLGNNSFRDFIYAGDAVKIAVELLERGQWGEVYNLGSETGIKIYDLAKLIGKLMGFADVVVGQDESRKRCWEIWMLLSCNDKIYSVVDARPEVDLEEALRRTIAWFDENGRRWPWEK